MPTTGGARRLPMSVGGGHDVASLCKANATEADHPATDDLNQVTDMLFRLDSVGFVWWTAGMTRRTCRQRGSRE
jgi:hypothetical protein